VIHDDEDNRRVGLSLRGLKLDDLLWNHAVMSAAGAAGEMRFRLQEGSPLDDAMRASHEDDRRSVGLIAGFTGQDADALQEAASRRARAMLDDPATWSEVVRLAEAIIAHWPDTTGIENDWGDGSDEPFVGVMPGAEITALLNAGPSPTSRLKASC